MNYNLKVSNHIRSSRASLRINFKIYLISYIVVLFHMKFVRCRVQSSFIKSLIRADLYPKMSALQRVNGCSRRSEFRIFSARIRTVESNKPRVEWINKFMHDPEGVRAILINKMLNYTAGTEFTTEIKRIFLCVPSEVDFLTRTHRSPWGQHSLSYFLDILNFYNVPSFRYSFDYRFLQETVILILNHLR